MILVLLATLWASAQKIVTIKGSVKGDFKGFNKVYLYRDGVGNDSALVENGAFEFKIPFTKPILAQIYCQYEAKLKSGLVPVAIFIDEPGVVYYKDVVLENGFHNGKLSGVKSVVEFNQHNQKLAKVAKQVEAVLAKKYGDSVSPASPDYNAYLSELYTTSKIEKNKVNLDFVRSNPDANLSGLILTGGISSMSAEELEKTHHLLSKRVAGSEYGKMISDYLAGLKYSAVGQTLEDFTLNDPNDKPFNFSQLSGKYVMIDFWASWCGPCKVSFPHMKALYEKYKGDRFEIYSISVDQSKSNWLAELKEQQLPWLHALDTKKLSKSRFGINGVPTVFLIDPQGKVLAKDVGLDPTGNGAVEKKLAEIFEAK